MKRCFLCIALAMILLLSSLLVSCDSGRSEEEIISDIVNSGTKALTVSIWLPTEADSESQEFQNRLSAVQNEINKYLIKNNQSTKVELHAISDSKYEEKLSERFTAMKKVPGNSAFLIANEYQNKADKVFVEGSDKDYMYELVYPEVLDNQLDVFLVRGYDNLLKNINEGNMYELDKYISVNGGKYLYLNKMIKSDILNAMKVNGKTYSIPNNHLYPTEGKFLLINKEIFDSFDYDISKISDIYSCEEFIKAVKLQNGDDVIPFMGSIYDVPNVSYWNKNGNYSIVSSSITSGNAPDCLLENPGFIKYVDFYKTLQNLSCVSTENSENKKVAVSVVSSNFEELKTYENDYYIYTYDAPLIDNESIYSSMFAISTYSANYDRAMKILYMIQSDTKIRTMLQYGIENEDYTIEYDDDNNATLKILDTAYKMNLLYTGNEYKTYRGEGYELDEWADVKDYNYNAIINPYQNVDETYENNQDKYQDISDNLEQIQELTNGFFNGISSLSKEEFDDVMNCFEKCKDINISEVERSIEEKETALAEMEDGEDKTKLENEIEDLKALKNSYYKYEFLSALLSSEPLKKYISAVNSLFEESVK